MRLRIALEATEGVFGGGMACALYRSRVRAVHRCREVAVSATSGLEGSVASAGNADGCRGI